MSVDVLLDRLHGVKRTGQSRWIAQCPAHEDHRASLAIREADDAKTLVHCFAGCPVHEVVGAVGLELSDLFPPRTDAQAIRAERRPFPAADVLRAVDLEATVVVVAAARLADGQALTEDDRDRLTLAASRITAAVVESGHA